jgi:hypothetical protein
VLLASPSAEPPSASEKRGLLTAIKAAAERHAHARLQRRSTRHEENTVIVLVVIAAKMLRGLAS